MGQKATLTMSTLNNVQSTITPSTPKANGKARKASLNGSTAINALTAAQAIEIAFDYGQNIAGQDGALTNAFKVFSKNDQVIGDMIQALSEGYMVRKLGYQRDEATRVIGLKKYNDRNPDKNTDENRTFEQERVMVAIRVLVHRAKKMAGIGKPVDTAAREATRAAKEAEDKAHESRLIAADAIVNPAEDVNPFDALARLVLTMKSLANKHSAKLVGDAGSAWRDWLASAPVGQPAPLPAKGKGRK
jgi:spore germination protein YaaH